MDATSHVAASDQPASSAGVEEDERLALAARSDTAAFAALYRRHRDAVFRYLRARCTNDDDALDLTAETFERALVGLQRYRQAGAGFPAWLLRIARNAAIDHGRRRRARPTPVAFLEVEQWQSAPDDPEATVIASDEHRQLRQLLRALPEPQRDALALRYSAGLTARQIGVVIGKSEEATQKLITRALSALKEAYLDEQR